MFQNQLWLEQKCLTDPEFAKTFGRDLESLSICLKQTNLSRGLTAGAISSLRQKLRSSLPEFVYPIRNMADIELKVRKSFYTRPYKEAGILTKHLPPKRFIGIGYRDKGTAKDPAEDASPRWQEVASRASQLERLIHELREDLLRENLTSMERIQIIIERRKCRDELQRIRASTANPRDAKETQRSKSDLEP